MFQGRSKIYWIILSVYRIEKVEDKSYAGKENPKYPVDNSG